MSLLKISSIYKLEVLKTMHKIKTKTFPNCFGDFLQILLKTHYYPTRLATGNNYFVFLLNKTNLQRSIYCEGLKLRNEFPNDSKN